MPSVFTLEAVFAKKGDALLLHYGPADAPKRILIDGGPRGVYRKYLEPRLAQIREDFEIPDDEALALRMAMVSHVDDDHVAGVLDLFRANERARERNRPPLYDVGTLWHNGFDDVLGDSEPAIVSRVAATAASNDPAGLPLPKMDREVRAVVAGTAQGRDLRNLAIRARVPLNKPFDGRLIQAPARKVSLGHGLWLTVVGPDAGRVAEFRKKWKRDLQAILAKERASARAAAFADRSAFNLASLCVLARMRRKTILLTGDARGDFVLEGLERARLLRKTRPLHVDVLKVPHHGSDRNVEDVFFERIVADHYVISGDGEHGNPERETLEMIRRARGRRKHTVHFTFTEDAWRRERNKKRKAALRAVAEWVADKPGNCKVAFRDPAADVYSVSIDLLDPLYE